MSDSLRPCGLQHARFPCLLPSLGSLLKLIFIELVMPSNHLVLSSSPPAFNLSQHQGLSLSWIFASGGQSIGALASVLLMNIQDWFPLELTGLNYLQSKGLSHPYIDYWKNQLYFHFFKKGRGNHRVKNALQYSVHERSNIYLIHKHCVSNEQGIGFLFWFLPFLVSQIWESQIDAENHP